MLSVSHRMTAHYWLLDSELNQLISPEYESLVRYLQRILDFARPLEEPGMITNSSRRCQTFLIEFFYSTQDFQLPDEGLVHNIHNNEYENGDSSMF